MTVELYPIVSCQISGSNSICSGESTDLTISLTGTPPWTIVYTEDGANPHTININNSPFQITVYPSTTTLYEVLEVSDIYCDGEVSGSALITVDPRPQPSAGSDQTIPYGTYTTLNGSAAGGSGNYSFHWEPSDKLENPDVQQPQTINLDESVAFTLTATDNNNGCEDNDEVVITIEGGALGCFPAAEPSTICVGESSQLNAMASGGSGEYTYLWLSNPGSFTSDLPNPAVSPVQTTTYTVTVDDGFNISSGNVTVVVNDLPVPEAGDDITIPNGTNTVLQGSAVGGSGSYSYHWEPADMLVDPNSQSPQTANLFTTTLFKLAVSDHTTGCQSEFEDQMTVVVTGNVLSVNPSAQPEEVCLGETIQLFALAGGGSGEYSYSWSSSTGFSSNEQNPVIAPSEPGSYIYQCSVDDGFNTVTGSVAVNVKPRPYVNLGPADTTICVYDTLLLDAGNPGAIYQWSNGSTQKTIRVGSTGIGYDTKTLSVIVTDQGGCSSEGEITIMFSFGACSGVNDPQVAPYVTLYPNPGSGDVILHTFERHTTAEISIVNPIGKKLREYIFSADTRLEQDIMLDLSDLMNGLYFIHFKADGLRPVTIKYLLVK
jgi:hypothetical protein